jgi:hypothetical protein
MPGINASKVTIIHSVRRAWIVVYSKVWSDSGSDYQRFEGSASNPMSRLSREFDNTQRRSPYRGHQTIAEYPPGAETPTGFVSGEMTM